MKKQNYIELEIYHQEINGLIQFMKFINILKDKNYCPK